MAPRFDRDAPPAGPLVRGFSGGGFVVEGETYPALLMTPERAEAWTPPPLDGLGPEHLAPLLALDPLPEFLILGTGAATVFPSRALIAALDAKGVGIEAMDSRAAARTWGLLRAEERWIVAALMPLD